MSRLKVIKQKKDLAKWEQFPKEIKLTVLFEADLKTLKII